MLDVVMDGGLRILAGTEVIFLPGRKVNST
jgi:hypothetical protein